MGVNKRKIGKNYEEIAARYLEQEGYEILETNYHCRFAELDLIALDGSCLCFVEVKYRKSAAFDAPEGVVTKKKMEKNRLGASFYRSQHGIDDWRPMRFDVVMIIGNQIQLYKNAF
ncbi:MAG: YraN family protein [Eubacterium sp.]|nr:YraN family protein [Eubacterium sp.]